MSLESAKNYGYIASIIFCIIPIISYTLSASIYAQLFRTITNLITNPNMVTDSSKFTTFNTLEIILIAGLITIALSFTALILFLIAQYKLSKYYNEPAIFRNIIYSILLTISYTIAIIITTVLILLATFTTIDTTGNTITFTPFIIAITVFTVLTIAFIILYALLWYRAFNKLGEKSGINTFKTVGLLFVIGMFIPIVSFIAWVFAAKGYKQLKPQQPPNNNYNTQTYNPTPTFDRIFCSQCGTENHTNAIYCKHCGQTIQTNPTNTTA